MNKSTSKAASELSRARWKKATPKERKLQAARMAEGRRKITPELRTEIARNAVKARWAKWRAERGLPPKKAGKKAK